MSTTVKVDGKPQVTVQSDDPAMEERIARYVAELVAPRSGSGFHGEWQIGKFLERCSRHESQIALMRALVEKGRMTRSAMVTGAKKSSGRELAGCRGSISKNAIACRFPLDWFKDSWDPKLNEFVTELNGEVRQALREGLQEMEKRS